LSRRVPRRAASPFRPKEVEGGLDASPLKITVICSRWNPTVTDALLRETLATLERHGARAGNITVVRVPGAFELPAAARSAISTPGSDALVVLGAIVRGETDHHEVLGHAVAGALAALSAETGCPIGFGLLTCDTMEQARKRSGKGAEAAEAAIEMANLLSRRARA
jgi:6,7-dimethyl-8-ribityllumazine synthase